MRKLRLRLLFVASVIGMMIVLAGCGGSEGTGGQGPVNHAHISGPTGSGWYPMSVLFADIWMDELDNFNVTVVEGGAIGNIREVNRGEDAQSGFAFASDFADAVQGTGVFEGEVQENVRAIGALYPAWWNFVVMDDSPIQSLEDFIQQGGHTIPGNPGDASELTTRRVFEAMGYTYEDLEKLGVRISYGSYSDAATQLRDGIIDMVVQGGAPEVVGLSEIDASRPVRPLPIPDDVLQALDEAGYGYTVDMVIPAGTYRNQTEDIPTVVTMSILIVHKDMDEEIVYQMTKALWENLDRIRDEQPGRGQWMDAERGYTEIVNPEENIHPGALRYYKEIGVAE
ncbi:TRAP transporter solute receptor, TAXI family [Caldalkalibacillus thermarum TA2.A1]|uniref:TAXI family TRAP transporter solute-binding subunit n=1 Tax=Caldalkalibacillus thermarum (strain TA2.A1) TaxID=986075 RepID=F5L5X3_CALTT|nr:TAXI family TRAP transporter solute-binding subunit [Caldalkalibacillus thermarum]EGL83246.1 TRAP transporter solute receptor, TAXI family [Caldalkalibacillus thermarum TA2.A1]QZT33581.1 TAXI family TRAP transporter solute-binding subunit [Caldalkalibacillus thermarum TA2.A1]